MLNDDGWTDGRADERTNGRKLARLCLPAKAGATMIYLTKASCYYVHLNMHSWKWSNAENGFA